MPTDRLSAALASGAARLPPAGAILALNPVDPAVLASLPRDRVLAVQPIRPDHDALAAAGHTVAPAIPADRAFAGAIVFLPRSRAAARAAIARAVRLTAGGPVVVDGQKTDGIDAMLRDLRHRGQVAEVLSKAHGKTFTLDPDRAADWSSWEAAAQPAATDGGLFTAAGAFSADGPDPASVALAAALPARLPARVADLGAGWGYLARAILDRPEVAEVHLVEADHGVLDLARAGLGSDPRARFHWADATLFHDAQGFDAVITNPPFHRGRTADPGLGRAFIQSAARLLRPSGALYLVANRHLPYEAALSGAFAEVTELAPGDAGPFKLIRAARPRPPARPVARPHATARR
ncbi:MAG: methyltransferase [Rhodobacteraceae bacterium]|jgi:16S rRNA (guanine1207-N2)-methyltransferase|nr:methyltransferase [Paracoccaceae bacterium]